MKNLINYRKNFSQVDFSEFYNRRISSIFGLKFIFHFYFYIKICFSLCQISIPDVEFIIKNFFPNETRFPLCSFLQSSIDLKKIRIKIF